MLMSAKETAQFLNLSMDTFRDLRRMRPDFPGPVTRTKFSRPQVESWLRTATPYVDALKIAKNVLNPPPQRERILTRGW